MFNRTDERSGAGVTARCNYSLRVTILGGIMLEEPNADGWSEPSLPHDRDGEDYD